MRSFLFGFDEKCEAALGSLGLLVLRLGVGLTMLFGHGWGKMTRLADTPIQFADPFGLGPTASLVLTVFAEVFCSLAIVLGLFTRAAALPLAITMLTAIFVIHADDPWKKQEFALMYLIPYLTLMIAGAGKYSLDSKLRG